MDKCWFKFDISKKEERKSMENPNDYRHGSVTRELPFLLAFEISVAIMAILITITSSLVIKRICRKMVKSRADLMFMVLSMSDVGVAAISMPALGVLGPLGENLLDSFNNGSTLPFTLTVICFDFPYTFSYLVTTVIAVDRYFLVTKQKRYENFITIKRLKYIVILILNITFVICLITYYIIPINYGNVTSITRKSYLIVNIISMIIILFAYLYILFFVRRQSNTMKSSTHNSTQYSRRLTKKILCIFICQTVCILPYLLMYIIDEFGGYIPVLLVSPWLSLLRNSQCFCDSLILLHNKKPKRKTSTAASAFAMSVWCFMDCQDCFWNKSLQIIYIFLIVWMFAMLILFLYRESKLKVHAIEFSLESVK